MPRRLLFALLLLVATPMALLAVLSANAIQANRTAAKDGLAELLSSQLSDADERINGVFMGYATRLDSALQQGDDIFETLRELRRELPFVRRGIYVDPKGVLLYPNPQDLTDERALELAAALPGLVDARPMPEQEARDGSASPSATKQSQTSKSKPKNTTSRPELLWQQWYMAGGAQVIYWKPRPGGVMVGVLLERSRWMADLIAALPDQVGLINRNEGGGLIAGKPPADGAGGSAIFAGATPIGKVVLLDEAKRPLYQWGAARSAEPVPLVTQELSMPLASWRLDLLVNQSVIPEASWMPVALSLGTVAIVLLAIGGYVASSVGREIAQAQSRVNFAGQVSHELRTPLTNIRLYTELAESDLGDLEEGLPRQKLRKRLEVIDHESRRLQRLVTGVLEMIRPMGKPIGVRRRAIDVCDLLQGIVDQFQPSFAAAGLTIESQCECDEAVALDPDIIEMILVNLIGNVEKYVPSGGRCRILAQQIHQTGEPISEGERSLCGPAESMLRVTVSDDGPGIATRDRARVFRPFERLNDSINAPSGTGIGLTIARRAAERHHGRLVLCEQSEIGGATFLLEIPITS